MELDIEAGAQPRPIETLLLLLQAVKDPLAWPDLPAGVTTDVTSMAHPPLEQIRALTYSLTTLLLEAHITIDH